MAIVLVGAGIVRLRRYGRERSVFEAENGRDAGKQTRREPSASA